MAVHLSVMQDSSEIVHYDTMGIPLYIRMGQLSDFPKYRAICHWHDDLEFIWVHSGHMFYYINGIRILLKPGDCLFINARQMHFGYGEQNQECMFLCILVQPTLMSGNHVLYQKYFQPIVENPENSFLHLSNHDGELCFQMQETLEAIWQSKRRASAGYELQALSFLNGLWVTLLQKKVFAERKIPVLADLSIQQNMTAYIYSHYTEPVSLEEIASSGNVCRSRCCSLFKKYTKESPIQFLNHYRLEVSCHLLVSTEMSITDIALACGFHHPSYYTHRFHQRYQCTPREYQQANRD